MKHFFLSAVFAVATLAGASVFAMTSTNFQINWDNMNEGGNEAGTSTNFLLHDTLGDISGTSTSVNYQISAGYRAQETTSALTFIVKTADVSTQTSYSAFSASAKTVTVSSAASFSMSDYIAVVENKGFSQKVAIGRITNITGTVLTVDEFNGATSTMSASPSGGDDFVYRMNGGTVAFGTLTAGAQNVSVSMTSVESSVANGYTVYMQGGTLLQNASAQAIATVTDGTVSVDAEEYGASVTGTRAYLPDTDLGVTTTQRVIQIHSGTSATPADRVAISYKLSILSSTAAGTYGQNVFYTLTANY